MIVGLELDGKLKKPKFDFDSEEVRYNHRFAPFGNVATPPPVQYPHFKVSNHMSRSVTTPPRSVTTPQGEYPYFKVSNHTPRSIATL